MPHDSSLPPGSLVLKIYNLMSMLCETQFSRVYIAIDTHEHSYVIIKEHKPDRNASPEQNSQDIGQFKLEASFLKKINSPYVAKLLDSGMENSRFYMVMEFIYGQTLKTIKEVNGPIYEIFALRLAKDIFRGLMDIHSFGIISRDIKPQNLIYNKSHVVHIDLGIAKKIGHQTSRAVRHCYTPLFAPPEQRNGQGTTEASDIFSSCATILWLTAIMEESQLETILSMPDGSPLQADDVLKASPSISRKLAAFLAKGMNPNPFKRWQSATEAYIELCNMP